MTTVALLSRRNRFWRQKSTPVQLEYFTFRLRSNSRCTGVHLEWCSDGNRTKCTLCRENLPPGASSSCRHHFLAWWLGNRDSGLGREESPCPHPLPRHQAKKWCLHSSSSPSTRFSLLRVQLLSVLILQNTHCSFLSFLHTRKYGWCWSCLLYTSEAAEDVEIIERCSWVSVELVITSQPRPKHYYRFDMW